MSRQRGPRAPAESAAADTNRDRVQRLGRISAELLHDLTGMLATVSGRVSLVREEADRGRIASDELQLIERDTRDLQRMISEVLEEVRDDPRSPEVGFALRETLERTIDRWVHSAPSVSTTLRGSVSDSARVRGPGSFLSRAFWNLLRNAGRHANQRIRITLEPAADSLEVSIHVEDDGRGVDPSLEHRLFEPFLPGPGGGMGLGLSFSRWALERLNGSLEYVGRSEELGGAHFRMTVPLEDARQHPRIRRSWPAAAGSGAKDETGALSGLRLVLVDDELALLSVLARVLRRAGAEVEEIPAGVHVTARGLADRLRAHDPDVLLIDLNLGGCTALEVLDELRPECATLVDRALLLTGGTPPDPPPGPPVVHKLVDWEDLYGHIRNVAESSADPD